LIYAIEEGVSYEEHISSYEKPFKDLRITLITFSGAVIFVILLLVLYIPKVIKK
jgi:hypothetical protein